jgi:hypothetical protein
MEAGLFRLRVSPRLPQDRQDGTTDPDTFTVSVRSSSAGSPIESKSADHAYDIRFPNHSTTAPDHTSTHTNLRGDLRLARGRRSPHAILAGAGERPGRPGEPASRIRDGS